MYWLVDTSGGTSNHCCAAQAVMQQLMPLRSPDQASALKGVSEEINEHDKY